MNTRFVPDPILSECKQVLTDLARPDATHQLVTVHGLADADDVWQPVCRALDMQFNSYQQLGLKWHRGVGEPYDYPECGAVLRQGWDQLPEQRKVVLIHSFGCNAFMKMLQDHPVNDVDAVVLLSPYYKPDFAAFTWPLFQKYVREFERFLHCSIDARTGGRDVTPQMREQIMEHLLQGYSPSSWVMFYQTWSTTPSLNLSKLTMPCKVLAASEDFSLAVQDVGTLASKLPNASFEILENLGHFSLIEDPEKTASHISSFLSERLDQ